MKLNTITSAIEQFAPLSLQLDYDNSGLQIGHADDDVTAVMLCLDVTEDVVQEALDRKCELIITHHPLLFRGLKSITGRTPVMRIVETALRGGVAIYSAHTNLDCASRGVSSEMARMLHLENCEVLSPSPTGNGSTGLGIVGSISPTPAIEFLRHLKETFEVKALRYSAQSPQLVICRVALCGGSGAEFIPQAKAAGADIYVSGDIKYHDFTSHASDIMIADIGHYESEVCARKLFARILREQFPDLVTHTAESDRNPIGVL